MEFLQNNFITDFFVFCLKGLHGVFGDYALSIVVLTVLLRLAMLPLDIKQRANQSKMSALGPEIQSLQKRYANNPQQLQRKQKELYSKMNVKPMMGCLPMLIQLPFLFAFFGAMRVLQSEQMASLILDASHFGVNSVTLPDFFWVHNFWQPDSGLANIMPNASEFLGHVVQNQNVISPEKLALLNSQGVFSYSQSTLVVTETYEKLASGIVSANGLEGYKNGWFVLPVLCGVALFVQQKFAPASSGTANPMMGAPGTDAESQQAQGCSNKVMMWVMPIFSVYICLQGNTAFALYWFTSSIYALLQSRIIDIVKKNKAKKEEIIVT